MLRRSCIFIAASLALAGCNLANKEEAQQDDASNPYYKKAQQDIDTNPGAAAADYEDALAANPKLAGAHAQLGLIYGDKLNDPISSIYHYKRYLALDPTSDKKDQIQGEIDKQSKAFAASVPNSSSDDDAKLLSQNAALSKQVEDANRTIVQLQAQLQKGHHRGHLALQPPAPPAGEPAAAAAETDAGTPATPPPAPADAAAITPSPAAPANAAPAPPAGPVRAEAVDTNAPNFNAGPPATDTNAAVPSGPSRSYTVVKGDSLWNIAKKMYPGDTKNGVDKITAANPGLNPRRLKLGQTLVIPQ